MKKHQLVEADILSHEDRIKDMNEQADSLVKSGQFDTVGMFSHKMSLITIFGHEHKIKIFIKKFDIFH